MTLGTIVFDLDGTLVDSMTIQADLFAKIASETLSVAPADARGVYLELAGIPLDRQFGALIKNDKVAAIDLLPKLVNEFFKRVVEIPFKTFPGVSETLSDLSSAGYNLAVISGSTPDIVNSKLQSTGLDRYVVCSLGIDYRSPRRDKTALLDQLPNYLGISVVEFHSNSVYVGDSISDILVASDLGIISIGIGSGPAAHDLLRHGAFLVLDSVNELPKKLSIGGGGSTKYFPIHQLKEICQNGKDLS